MEQVFEKLTPDPDTEGNGIKAVSIEWNNIKNHPEYTSLSPSLRVRGYRNYYDWLKTKYIVKKKFGFMCYYNKPIY